MRLTIVKKMEETPWSGSIERSLANINPFAKMYFSQICGTLKLTTSKISSFLLRVFQEDEWYSVVFMQDVCESTPTLCFRERAVYLWNIHLALVNSKLKVWNHNCDKLYQGAVFSCHAYFTLFLRGCLVVS